MSKTSIPSSLFYSPLHPPPSLKNMAINLNSGDSSACSSPRYSFSNELLQYNPNQTQEEVHPNRLDMSLLSSSSSSLSNPNLDFDFNFCVDAAFPQSESFPADDLFYNGVIIPTQMKQKLNSMQQEEVTSVTTATIIREEKSSLKSFWRFRRSSSLNCENYGHKKSSSSWSMPLLFRSKSTGSSSSNDNPKQSHKNSSSNNGKSMNTTTTTTTTNNNNQSVRHSTSSCQKPPLKKSGSGGHGSYVNGVRVCSSAMNVPPPPYITKGTSDLLGFSSLFRNGSREKKSKI